MGLRGTAKHLAPERLPRADVPQLHRPKLTAESSNAMVRPIFDLAGGFQFSAIGHVDSPLPLTLFLPRAQGGGNIFMNDVRETVPLETSYPALTWVRSAAALKQAL
jgi:hypothetical protein